MPELIHQEVTFDANAQAVYAALTDAKQFSELTQAPAEIDPTPGGAFSCFGGIITGETIEAVPGERLIQAWRVANWEPNVTSVVKFELESLGPNKTKLIFEHAGFPQEHREHLAEGWHTRYWDPLKTFLGRS
jgi:activator of HSP90 ATPase